MFLSFRWEPFAYANKDVCTSYIVTKSHPRGSNTILGYNMANFSVEWLSKSYYEETTQRQGFSKAPSLQYSPTSPNSKLTDKRCLEINRTQCSYWFGLNELKRSVLPLQIVAVTRRVPRARWGMTARGRPPSSNEGWGPSSPPSRSANWRTPSASTNTWVLFRGRRLLRGWTFPKLRWVWGRAGSPVTLQRSMRKSQTLGIVRFY